MVMAWCRLATSHHLGQPEFTIDCLHFESFVDNKLRQNIVIDYKQFDNTSIPKSDMKWLYGYEDCKFYYIASYIDWVISGLS